MSALDPGRRYLLDTSVFLRARQESVRASIAAALEGERLLTTPPLIAEMLQTARNRREFERLEKMLDALPPARFPGSLWAVARDATRALAGRQSGYHRVSIADALIAAAAQENALGVLHYDHHYDRLAEVLVFESRWIAPAGSLD